MGWAAAIIAVIAAIYAYTQIQKPQNQKPPSLDELDVPTADEGRCIPVLFGRRKIKSPNTVWYGDLDTPPVRKRVKGLTGSSYQTIGYKVNLGMHLIFGIGPFDSVDKIEVGDKVAWEGYSTGGRITISQQNLFGGEEKQGGVMGEVDLEFGLQDQLANDYLVSVLGEDVPAYRGVVGAVVRRAYLGTTAYIKPWALWGTRIHSRSDGSVQWYDEKSAVMYDPGEIFSNDLAFPATSAAIGPYAGVTIDSGFTRHDLIMISKPSGLTYSAWSRWSSDSDPLAEGLPWANDFWVTDNDTGITTHYWGDEYYATQAEAESAVAGRQVILAGATSYTIWLYDVPVIDNRGGLSLRILKNGKGDMNPAHIVREALTDRKFALRHSDEQIDDEIFRAAADVLFDEGTGMSLYWTSENSIFEFISEVLRHINGSCYVDKATGKWVLKLVRDDYSESDLVYIGESNIVKVTDYKQPTLAELTNSITVVYWNAETGEDASLTINDQVLIEMQGGIVNETIQYPGFTNHDIAARTALRDLKARSTPMISCTVTCDRTAAGLNIGDPFIMNWPDLKIQNLVMRVESISLGDSQKSEIVIGCVQDVFAALTSAGSSPVSAPDDGLWVDPTAGIPEAAFPRVAEEAPYQFMVDVFGMADADAALSSDPNAGIALVAAGRQFNEISAQVKIDAGTGYEDSGVLDFCAWAEIDDVAMDQTTIYVAGSSKDLSRVIVPALAIIRDESVLVTEIGTDSNGQYFIVERGVLDSVPQAHEVGSAGLYIVVWEQYAYSDEVLRTAGNSIYIQLVTSIGGAELEDPPTDSIDFDSRAIRPYPPANVKVNGEYMPAETIVGDVTLTFRERNRRQTEAIVGWFADTDVVGEAGQTYGYRIYHRDDLSLIGVASGIAGSPIDLPLSALSVRNRIELFSERDGYESLDAAIIDFDWGFAVIGYPPGGAVNETYSYAFVTDGAAEPIAWSISAGSLPAGWSLNSSSGVISGVATSSGDSTFTVRVEDAAGLVVEHEYQVRVGVIACLMHLNGSNGSTTFTDQTGKTWTRSGSAVISTSQSKFGGASLSVPASADYITTSSNAAFAYGTADFTVDFWVRPTVLSGVMVVFDHRTAVNQTRPAIYFSGSQLRYFVSNADRIAGGTFAINTWYHIALCRSAGVTRLFADGMQIGSNWTDTTNYTQGPLYLATPGDLPGTSLAFRGFIDEVRVCSGVARYTQNFTPPVAPSDYPVVP